METASDQQPTTVPVRVVLVAALLVLVAMLAFVRGRDHQRGDEEGAVATSALSTADATMAA